MNIIRRIVFDGAGIALYVVVSFFLSFPIVENWYLSLGYTVMVVFLYSIGIIDGTIIGVLGTALYCLLINMLWGMPGWMVGNVIICFIVGMGIRLAGNVTKWTTKTYIMIILIMVLSSIIGILLAKSFIETFYYEQPMIVRMGRNFGACIMDIVGLFISIPIIKVCGNKLKDVYVKGNNI